MTELDIPPNSGLGRLSRRLRAEMPDPINSHDRSRPPPGMTVGYAPNGRSENLVSTRLFAMPGSSCVELGETRDVPREHWEAEATKDAWAWYDKWAPDPRRDIVESEPASEQGPGPDDLPVESTSEDVPVPAPFELES